MIFFFKIFFLFLNLLFTVFFSSFLQSKKIFDYFSCYFGKTILSIILIIFGILLSDFFSFFDNNFVSFVFSLFLSISVFTDIIELSIYTIIPILMFVFYIFIYIFGLLKHISFIESVISFLSILLFLFLISFFSKKKFSMESIGNGDVILIPCISLYVGFYWVISAICIGSIIGSLYYFISNILNIKINKYISFIPLIYIGIVFYYYFDINRLIF
jgi:prepilin signal peptidase PulO-like enzyme (type II secretory pathway)